MAESPDTATPAFSTSPSTASAARWLKTTASRSEFEASRLAPCIPVQATSPAA